MRLFDTHCHLNSRKFDGIRNQKFRNARDAGVERMTVIGTDLPSSKHALTLASLHEALYAACGVHPHEADGSDEHVESELIQMYAHRKCVAVGECGLDYYYEYSDRKKQQAVFRWHIQQSHISGKPLVIHIRDAWEDALFILQETGGAHKGVIHCFTGTPEQATACLKMGFYISIPGIVTFKNAADLQETVRMLPSDKILIETDSPYLAPIPMRGQMNEPAFVKYVFDAVYQLRQDQHENETDLATQLWQNSLDLFQIQE